MDIGMVLTPEIEAAQKLYTKATQRYQAYVESKGADIQALKELQQCVPPGLYEHWKSVEGAPKFYLVYGAGCEVDVYTPMVTYTALYGDRVRMLINRNLLDSERGFLAPVSRGEYSGPRFKLIEKLQLKQFSLLLDYAGELMIEKSLMEFRLRAGDLLRKKIALF